VRDRLISGRREPGTGDGAVFRRDDAIGEIE
jgi:hypothetical protein